MLLRRLMIAAATILLPAVAQAQHTITFEQATGCNQTGPGYFASVRNGYEGFSWNNGYSANMHSPDCAGLDAFLVGPPPNGIYTGVHGGDWDAYDAGAFIDQSMSRLSDPFNVLGLWATSQLLTGMQVRAVGYGPGGGLLYNEVFTIDAAAPTYLDLGYTGIETLSLSWVVGTGLDSHGQQSASLFAVDDIVVSGNGIQNDPTAAPEPASIILMFTGLAGVGGVAVRRKRTGR